MKLSKQNILGIGVTTNSKNEILEYIEKYLGKSAKKPLVIVTPNPEQIVVAQRDSHFREILNGADVAIPDGIGLALIAGCKKIAGVDLMEDLVGLAARRSLPVALIGGRGGVALKALECLQARFPGLSGWAQLPEEKTIEEIGKKIADSRTQLVFVGLGAPKQEYFIEKLKVESLRLKVAAPLALMSVGGSFDELSGRISRPPAIIDKLGLKWFWRLILEPWRWKRQLSLVKFVYLICKSHLK